MDILGWEFCILAVANREVAALFKWLLTDRFHCSNHTYNKQLSHENA